MAPIRLLRYRRTGIIGPDATMLELPLLVGLAVLSFYLSQGRAERQVFRSVPPP